MAEERLALSLVEKISKLS